MAKVQFISTYRQEVSKRSLGECIGGDGVHAFQFHKAGFEFSGYDPSQAIAWRQRLGK